ncbi:MAG: lipopolysaccharide heptosyltransferase II [Chthoniobacterales bacterium]
MDRFVYFVALAVVSIIRRLPLKVCYAFGEILGMVLWIVLPRYRRLASRNLAAAFHGEKTPAQISAMTREHFRAMCSNGICALKMAEMPEEVVQKLAPIEGLDGLWDGIRKGKGVVVAISHIGNWELCAQVLAYIRPTPAGTVFQALRNPYINKMIDKDRRKRGGVTFDRKKGFAGPLAMLREGGVVGVLIDQRAGTSGVWTPLFNQICSTSPLAAALASRTGAQVIPAAVYTEGFAKWRIVVGKPVPYDPANQDQLTYDLNLALEAQIRESPKDWFWVHNRWRMQDPDFLLGRAKRGVFLPENLDSKTLRPFRIIIRSSNWLGDAVMSAPAVTAIKHGRPDAFVTILTPAKLADFWKEVEGVDAIITTEPGVFATAAKIRGKADVAIIFPNSTRTALEAYLAKIPRRVGCRGHFRKHLLNQIPTDKRMKRVRPEHQSLHYLRLANWVGAPDLPPAQPKYTVPPSPPYQIGICPGAEYGPAKRWPAERFAETIRTVSEKLPVKWTIVGTRGDMAVAEEIAKQCPNAALENKAGTTSLAELIAFLKTLHLLITNDTGTMHLAAYLGVPTISIFGSTEPILTGPIGPNQQVVRHQVECSPCFLRECPIDFRCMKAVEPAEIAELTLTALEKQSTSSS